VGAAHRRRLHQPRLPLVLLYRLSRAAWKCHIPLVPLILTRLAQHLFAVDIAPAAELGPGVVIVHCFGVVIGSDTKIEGDCCIFHGVTFGDRGSEWTGSDRPDGHPRVERDCMFGAGAKILGPIRIGRNSVIGANAVVLCDVPPTALSPAAPRGSSATRPQMDENLRPIKPPPADLPPLPVPASLSHADTDR